MENSQNPSTKKDGRRLAWKIPFTALWILIAFSAGCGTVKQQKATDQLLISDAVDRTLSQISFAELSGSTVFIDTQYIRSVRSNGCVDSNYVVSCLRELAIRDGCILQENRNESEFVVEVRMGALGTDNHEVNYGIPGSSAVNQTASLITSAPIPAIPEISLARKDERRAAAKISLFAYNRETREAVWQTGTIMGLSQAKSTWVLGAGPFHQGDIYDEDSLRTSPVNVQISDNPIVKNINPIKSSTRLPKSMKLVSHEEAVKPDRFSREALIREKQIAARQPQRLPETHDATEMASAIEPKDDSEEAKAND